MIFNFPCLAEPLSWSEAAIHQAVIPQCGGPDESETGDTPCCQEEQGKREKQHCLCHHAHKVCVGEGKKQHSLCHHAHKVWLGGKKTRQPVPPCSQGLCRGGKKNSLCHHVYMVCVGEKKKNTA